MKARSEAQDDAPGRILEVSGGGRRWSFSLDRTSRIGSARLRAADSGHGRSKRRGRPGHLYNSRFSTAVLSAPTAFILPQLSTHLIYYTVYRSSLSSTVVEFPPNRWSSWPREDSIGGRIVMGALLSIRMRLRNIGMMAVICHAIVRTETASTMCMSSPR